jgi:hypothetical protein
LRYDEKGGLMPAKNAHIADSQQHSFSGKKMFDPSIHQVTTLDPVRAGSPYLLYIEFIDVMDDVENVWYWV